MNTNDKKCITCGHNFPKHRSFGRACGNINCNCPYYNHPVEDKEVKIDDYGVPYITTKSEPQNQDWVKKFETRFNYLRWSSINDSGMNKLISYISSLLLETEQRVRLECAKIGMKNWQDGYEDGLKTGAERVREETINGNHYLPIPDTEYKKNGGTYLLLEERQLEGEKQSARAEVKRELAEEILKLKTEYTDWLYNKAIDDILSLLARK